MKHRSPNTLAYFHAAPHTHRHDLSAIPVSVFGAATKKYRQSCGLAAPQEEATTFYTLNHAASVVSKLFTPNEPLPTWASAIMARYTDVALAQGQRMLHYILTVTTREMRHWEGHGNLKPEDWASIKTVGTQKMIDFIKTMTDNTEDQMATKYMNTPPDVTIGQYVKALSAGFHRNGTGWGGGWGGIPWGNTTDAVVKMVTGQISLEMLVDVGYTLAHNGGPIFDKGMLYSGYNDKLQIVLDVQRTGQMLDLMFEGNTLGVEKTFDALDVAKELRDHVPGVFKGSVDWKLVADSRTQEQKNAHPGLYAAVIHPPKPKPTESYAAKKKAAAKAKAAAVPPPTPPKPFKVAGTQAAHATGQWQVYPNQTVTTYQRGEK